MESIRRLEEFVAQVDFKSNSSPTRHDHRDIYTYIEQTVLSPKSPITRHVPTLKVIIYSINNILYPTLATRRIPELLDLLATAEFYRKHTLDQARSAMVWNNYYHEETDVTLSAQEKQILERLESGDNTLRQIYVKIVTLCCHLDMYNLWTAEVLSITDFWVRFNEYFPFLNKNYNNTPPLFFHSGLSDDELAQLADVGWAFCDFVQDAMEWAIHQQSDGRPISELFHTKEFRAAFPNPCDYQVLLPQIEYFLSWINNSVTEVKEMFSGNA